MNHEPASQVPPAGEPFPVQRRQEPFWWLFALVVAAIIARFAIQWNVAVPTCGFRQLTSLPCPLCGGTRALGAAAELDLWMAVQFNPLVMLGAAVVFGWVGLGLIDLGRTQPLVPRLNQWLRRHYVWWIIAGLTVANWGYLMITLP